MHSFLYVRPQFSFFSFYVKLRINYLKIIRTFAVEIIPIMIKSFKIVLFYKLLLVLVLVGFANSTYSQCNADAGNNITMCAGVPTQLDGSSSTVPNGTIEYSWSPSTGLSDDEIANPICTATSTITYTLTITNGGGCTDTDQITVTVNPNPTANFTFASNNQCANLPVVFTNTST